MAKIFFNTNVAFLRKKAGVSQLQFAHIIGTNRATLASWEEHRSCAKLPTLVIICNALGVTVDDMLLKDFRVEMREITEQ